MGIKELNPFLKKSGINCFCKIPLTAFSEGRIAIDGLNWLFKYLPSVYNRCLYSLEDPLDLVDQEILLKEMYKEILIFSNKWLNYKVTLVWIWDGVSKDNKTTTKIERKKSRQALIETRDKLREELLEMSPLERDINLLEKYKKLVLNTVYISRKSIESIKTFCKKIGMPTIIADDEAENLASSLAVQRKISAVWSSDTDTYPLGAPIVVNGFENINGILHIKGTFTLEILKALNMTHTEFRDFCILLGTDFNDRMMGVGPAKSKILIEKYSTLENIESSTKHNLTMMNYTEVREQLTPYKTEYNCENFQVDKSLDIEELKSLIDIPELSYYVNNIKDLPKSKPVPKIK